MHFHNTVTFFIHIPIYKYILIYSHILIHKYIIIHIIIHRYDIDTTSYRTRIVKTTRNWK